MLDNQGRPYAAPAFYNSPPPSMLPLPKFCWRSTSIISGALSGPETTRLECQPIPLISDVTSHDGKSAVLASKKRDESIDTRRIQETKTTVPTSFTRSIAFEKLAQRMREATFTEMQHSTAQQHHQPTTILTRPKPRSILSPLSPPFTSQQSHQEPHPTNEPPNLKSPPCSLQNQNTTKTPVPLASKEPEEVTLLKEEEFKQLEEKQNEETEGHVLPHPHSPTTTITTTTIPPFPIPPTKIHQGPGNVALGTAANDDDDSGLPPPFCEICVQDHSLSASSNSSTSNSNSDCDADSDSDSADDDQKHQEEEKERIGPFSSGWKKFAMKMAKGKRRSGEEEEGFFTAGDRSVVKYFSQWGLRR
ncbi:hypothetical protein BDR22DRAFT_962908 [Usnea florida]